MKRVKRRGVGLCLAALFSFFVFSLPSCNVTRTITTASQYYQRGDTSCVIQTKTIESYDASKR